MHRLQMVLLTNCVNYEFKEKLRISVTWVKVKKIHDDFNIFEA